MPIDHPCGDLSGIAWLRGSMHTHSTASAEIEVPDDARYVRFACWGRGEQFAWPQPFLPT